MFPNWLLSLAVPPPIPPCLLVTSATPTPAEDCVGCVRFTNNLLACENEWPLEAYDYRDLNSQFPGVYSLGCVCIGQLTGFTGGTTGLQQMINCWKCLPGNKVSNPLLYKWIVTCETYYNDNYGPIAALECWNSGLEEGCV